MPRPHSFMTACLSRSRLSGRMPANPRLIFLTVVTQHRHHRVDRESALHVFRRSIEAATYPAVQFHGHALCSHRKEGGLFLRGMRRDGLLHRGFDAAFVYGNGRTLRRIARSATGPSGRNSPPLQTDDRIQAAEPCGQRLSGIGVRSEFWRAVLPVPLPANDLSIGRDTAYDFEAGRRAGERSWVRPV